MSKRDRLLQQISETSAGWHRLGIRLGRLKLARELETRVEEHLRLDPLIAEVDASRTAVGSELEMLEAQLNALNLVASKPECATPPAPPLIFWSYSHADEQMRDELARYIESLPGASGLKHFYDRHIPLGAEPQRMAAQHLASARLILLLVSADYLADDDLDSTELRPAVRRHEDEQAIVIPILLRACMWADAPFAKLQVLPKGGVAVQSWPDRELVLRDVAQRVHEAAMRLQPR